MASVDLGHLNPDCPLIPLDEDEICGDNPDPPEVIDMEGIEWKGKVVVTLTIIEWRKSRHLSRHLQQQQQQQPQQRYLLQSVVSHQLYFIFITIHLTLVGAKSWCAVEGKKKCVCFAQIQRYPNPGNMIVEKGEECDCGEDYLECQVARINI